MHLITSNMLFNEIITKTRNFKFYLKKIDYFSDNISFTHNESKRLNSTIGLVLTCIMVLLTATITLLFGKEIFNKSKPYVSESIEFNNNSKHILQKDSFLMFSLKYKSFELINSRVSSSLKIVGYIYTIEKSVLIGNETLKLNFTECREEELYQAFSNNYHSSDFINSYFCFHLPIDINIYNPLRYINSRYLSLYISKNNEIVEYDEILNQMAYMDILYKDTYVDNFDFENPIKSFINNEIVQFNINKTSLISFNVKNSIFISDNGLLFTDTMIKKYWETEIFKESVYKDDHYLRINFSTNMISKKHNKSYLKIQELLAGIGGFVNGFIIICRVLFNDFFEYNYLVKINRMVKDQYYNLSAKNEKLSVKKYNKTQSDDIIIKKDSNDKNYENKEVKKADIKDSLEANNINCKVNKQFINYPNISDNIYNYDNNKNRNEDSNINAYNFTYTNTNNDLINKSISIIKARKDFGLYKLQNTENKEKYNKLNKVIKDDKDNKNENSIENEKNDLKNDDNNDNCVNSSSSKYSINNDNNEEENINKANIKSISLKILNNNFIKKN